MEYIDKDSFERYVDKAFTLTVDERNQLYHRIYDSIVDADLTPKLVAAEILVMVDHLLAVRKNEVEYKAAEKSEGREPGAVFRRIG
jgi:hypothetical protein